MRRLCLRFVLVALISYGLSSCTKNKLESVVLTTNPHEEFSMMVPVRITGIGTFIPTPGNCRAVVSFEIVPEYVSFMNNRPYVFVIYRDGNFVNTLSSGNDYINDPVTCSQTYTYTISLRYTDDSFETLKSVPESAYIN